MKEETRDVSVHTIGRVKVILDMPASINGGFAKAFGEKLAEMTSPETKTQPMRPKRRRKGVK